MRLEKTLRHPLKYPALILVIVLSVGLGVAVFLTEEARETDEAPSPFVGTAGSTFVLNGHPYRFAGLNFWHGAYLAADVIPGGRARLLRELDLLKRHGVSNLRITAATQRSDISRAVRPAFQDGPSRYSETLLRGLDFLLNEMADRQMKAVLVMGNYWEWSGGMAQYVAWANGVPVFDPAKNNDATAFMAFASEFYRNKKAWELYFNYLEHVIDRINTVTGVAYNEDPTIMAWQLANEPRPHPAADKTPSHLEDFYAWIDAAAKRIHALAPKQLVSVGSEGAMGCLGKAEIYQKAHVLESVDYMTVHIWPKNWGWYVPEDETKTVENAVTRAAAYYEEHIRMADALQKPVVLEEFGLGRDGENPSLKAKTTARDTYLTALLEAVAKSAAEGRAAAGTNIWAWGGEGRAAREDAVWVEGSDFTGDPPQEPQGLNSIFDKDTSTLSIIRAHAAALLEI